MDNKILLRIMMFAIIAYAAMINLTLVFSMLLSLAITVIFVLLIEVNDKDIIKAYKTNEVPDNVTKKYIEILLMGFCTFIALTALINKLITNV